MTSEIKPEQIPAEAKAAFERELGRTGFYTDAIAAALNAWPDAWQTSDPYEVTVEAFPRLILPLTEKPND